MPERLYIRLCATGAAAAVSGKAECRIVQQKPAGRHSRRSYRFVVTTWNDPDNAGFFVAQGPRAFCGDLRHFRLFSKNLRVSATIRRSPKLQVVTTWDVPITPCFL